LRQQDYEDAIGFHRSQVKEKEFEVEKLQKDALNKSGFLSQSEWLE